MELFENYDRRINKINDLLRTYKINSIEETKSVQNDFGVVDINPIDFYIVLNSAYNDYYNISALIQNF